MKLYEKPESPRDQGLFQDRKLIPSLTLSRFTWCILGYVAYLVVFSGVYLILGEGHVVTAAIPILVFAYHYGMWGGIAAGVLSFPSNALLTAILGGGISHLAKPSLNGFVWGGAIVFGAVVGRLRTVSTRYQKMALELHTALQEVKTLSGLLPICAHCKSIRDDRGYWQRVETYLGEHSNVEFSHGICPKCVTELYPEFANEMIPEAGEGDGNELSE